MLKQTMRLMLLPAAAAVLVACGGGGGSPSTGVPLSISGTAAIGAPLSGAKVQVFDAAGDMVVGDGLVRADGSYNVTIPAGKRGPFVFVVDDGDQQFMSVLSDTSQTTVNITPLSNLLAASFSPSGNPANLVNEIVGQSTQINPTTYAAKVAALRTAIAPVLTAAGVTASTFDPVRSVFSANGAGIDKVLDVMEVSITPSTASSNIELTVKISLNEDDVNPNNSLKFNTTAGLTGVLPNITAADLPSDGTSLLIQELLNRLTACFSVPLANRISPNGTLATHITAQACKDVFINATPSQYLSNGSVVGKTSHFGGIFTSTAPVTFERPKFFGAVRTSQANGPQAGDMLIGYRWKDSFDNFQYERVMVRKTNTTPAKLEIVGNGYLYDSAVTPYAQLRQFIQNDDRNYYSVGYVPFVANRKYPANVGKSVDSVNVTTPSGRVILLCRDDAYSFLVMAAPPVAPAVTSSCTAKTGTSFIRLRSEYANKETTQINHPRLKDTSIAFVGADWTDDDLENVKTSAAWKYEFTFSDNSTAVQWHRPARRVHSVREFKKVPLPTVTPTMLTSMKANVVSNLIPIPADGVQVSWVKAYASVNGIAPEDAVPMTAIRIFGRYNNNGAISSFEDRMIVRSNNSQATIKCPSTSEAQCESATAAKYKASATQRSGYSGLDLWSRGPDGVEYVNFYATYMINP
jgi:hypothetical protein